METVSTLLSAYLVLLQAEIEKSSQSISSDYESVVKKDKITFSTLIPEVAESMGENGCCWCMMYIWLFFACNWFICMQRGTMRSKFGIQGKNSFFSSSNKPVLGDSLNDFLMGTFCGPCAMGQMRHEGIGRRQVYPQY